MMPIPISEYRDAFDAADTEKLTALGRQSRRDSESWERRRCRKAAQLAVQIDESVIDELADALDRIGLMVAATDADLSPSPTFPIVGDVVRLSDHVTTLSRFVREQWRPRAVDDARKMIGDQG